MYYTLGVDNFIFQQGIYIMRKLSLSLLIVGCLVSSAASAQQWKHVMPTYENWYVRADVDQTKWNGNAGLVSNQLPNGTNTDMIPYWNMTKEAGLGLGIGVGFSHHLRSDLTFTQTRFSTASSDSTFIRNVNVTGDLKTRIRARTALANLYWDLGHFSSMLEKKRVQPYVGGGLGVSYNFMSDLTEYSPGTTNIVSHIPGHAHWATAFQYGGGIFYQLQNSPIGFDFSYMYLNAGKGKSTSQMDVHSSSNEQLISPATVKLHGERWSLGLRWQI
jgi:opacity protein-like surface antigen